MYFVIAGILLVVALGGLVTKLVGPKDRRTGRRPGLAVFVGALVAFVLVTGAFSATTIGARSVGIQTSFGQYTNTLDNGFHWTAPWSSVEEFSTQIQDLDIDVPVSFDGGSSGTVSVTVLWAIQTEEAEELWKDWKTFDRVRDRLVKPNAQTEVAAVLSTYSPEDARNGENRRAIQEAVFTALVGNDEVDGSLEGRGITIDSIQVTNVELGERAQNSVDRIAEAAANTQRAQEEQERAVIEAETARIRQESQTPEALQRYCLEIVNAWNVDQNGPLPATFNCALGETGQVPVIVGQP